MESLIDWTKMAEIKPPKGFPKKLNVLGVDFKCLYFDDPHIDPDDINCVYDGLCCIETGEIRINTKCGPRDFMWQILFHEVLEAITFVFPDLHIAKRKNHGELDIIAKSMYQALRDSGVLKR